jgi:hypothetical protein
MPLLICISPSLFTFSVIFSSAVFAAFCTATVAAYTFAGSEAVFLLILSGTGMEFRVFSAKRIYSYQLKRIEFAGA